MIARVLGVDASPTATGLALPDGTLRTLKNRRTEGDRLLWIDQQLAEATAYYRPHLVVLEGYNYGLRKFGRVFEIGEVGGLVKLNAARMGIPLARVSPQGRAKFGTGTGNAKKEVVLANWTKLTGLEFGDDNQCDAHILREAGMHLLGQPTLELRSTYLQALDVIRKEQGAAIRAAAELTTQPPGGHLALCQVVGYDTMLTCGHYESGGVRCEELGPHEQHWISDHTKRHSLAGNGYACTAIRAQDAPKAA